MQVNREALWYTSWNCTEWHISSPIVYPNHNQWFIISHVFPNVIVADDPSPVRHTSSITVSSGGQLLDYSIIIVAKEKEA